MKRVLFFLAALLMAAAISGCIISITPSEGTVDITVGDDQNFAVLQAFPEPAVIAWYLDGNPVAQGSTYTYTAFEDGMGSHVLTATAYSILDTDSVSWVIEESGDTLWDDLIAYFPFDSSLAAAVGTWADGVWDPVGEDAYGTYTVGDDPEFEIFEGIQFDGIDDLVEMDDGIMNGLDDFTVAFWALGWNDGGALSCANASQANELLLYIDDEGFKVFCKGSSAVITVPTAYASFLALPYYHVALTRESGTLSLYINGSPAGVATVSGALAVDDGGFWLGCDQDSVGGGFEAGQYCNGMLDELRVYETALSADQIAELGILGPNFTTFTLEYSTDLSTWNDVSGGLYAGFGLGLPGTSGFYYLNVGDAETSYPLFAPNMYPFYVTDTYPSDFLTYWGTRGVYDGCTGDWQPIMWQIINKELPIFYLAVDDTYNYSLIDGLQYQLDPETAGFLRIDGDYPDGTYAYAGVIADINSVVSPLIVVLQIVNP